MSTLSERDRLTIQTALDRSTRALAYVAEHLPRLRRKMAAWERCGNRSSSIPEAISHTADPPEVVDKNGGPKDPFDRIMRDDVKWLIAQAKEIEGAAVRVEIKVGSYLTPAAMMEEEEREWCSNLPCTNRVPQGVKTCSRCRVHKARHGLAWPRVKGSV